MFQLKSLLGNKFLIIIAALKYHHHIDNMIISALTYIGTQRATQHDANLVNGNLLTDGSMVLENQEIATCFVADGVAGFTDEAFALKDILDQINKIAFGGDWMINISKLLRIN